MKNPTLFAAFLALGASFLSPPAHALAPQGETIDFPAASPLGKFEQRVGLTDVSVEYSRPSVKDRTIFGDLVPFGQVWRTGANAATKVTFSTDVTFGGTPVPAGTYALFTIPGEKEWTVMLSKVVGQWGSYAYDQKDDAARVKIKPIALAEPVETFTIDVGHLRDASAHLTLTWDRTRVAVPIATDLVKTLVPRIEEVMASAAEKKPYLAAAMFYYEHDLDLARALDWINAAALEQPEAVWIVYRKALIQAKAGDTAGAVATAKKAMELAKKAGGSLGSEYTHLSQSLLARLQ